MPRFFVDLRDGDGLVRDGQGAFYIDVEDAIDQARQSALDLAKQYQDCGIHSDAVCIELRDVKSRTIASLTVGEVLSNERSDDGRRIAANIGQGFG